MNKFNLVENMLLTLHFTSIPRNIHDIITKYK